MDDVGTVLLAFAAGAAAAWLLLRSDCGCHDSTMPATGLDRIRELAYQQTHYPDGSLIVPRTGNGSGGAIIINGVG